MKRICFFNSYTAWGGAEKWYYMVSLWCKQQGYSVLVITNRKSELFNRLQQESIALRQIHVSNLSFLNPFKIFFIKKVLQEQQIDTIILNLSCDVKVAGLAARLTGVKNILYRRGTALPVKDTFLNRCLFRYIITMVIANSKEIQRTILQNNPSLISTAKIKILYNGFDLETYKQEQTAPLYQRKPGELVLGNAARFVEQKGQKYLLELVKLLKDQEIKCTLLLAGKGKLEEGLRQYARTLGVDDDVIFLGFVEDIKSFMESIDIFVLPSLHEGSANIVLETMASAKPVVAFDVSSIPEMVISGRTGFLVEPGNVAKLADAVKNLLFDKNLQIEFGCNARKYLEEHFTMERMFHEMTTILEES